MFLQRWNWGFYYIWIFPYNFAYGYASSVGESTSSGTRIGATSQDLGARNSAECMTDVGFQEFRDIGLQPVGLDLETKGSNDYVDGLMPGVSYWN